MKQTRREFVRTLFVASQAVVASRFLPGSLFAESVPASSDGLNFLVFGDWGRQGEQDQVEVATQMANTAGKLNPKFVISVGDNFYTNGVKSVEDPHWQKSFEKVYHAASLQVPWQVILGNHDYHGNCDAQIAYGKISPRWKMPARYYILTQQVDADATVDFFYLDTTPMIKSYYRDGSEKTRAHVITQDVPKQLAWFKSALTASKAQWKIVLGHHPIYSGGEHGDTPELIESILPLLQKYKVQAYFNGHDHDLQHLQAGEVNLFCSGAGSQFRPTRKTGHTKFAEACSGFTTVSLQSNKMNVSMIDNKGALVYATTVLVA
ncbi:MAG TPA: tartrate-resistant acid phosphatase type 5 family protein [Candidatus Saccharimonadales bacterium]|nr:tartrate-resistant acid phosphatase type 5 family protein [Candidatus Saccharimonadales bacterium]